MPQRLTAERIDQVLYLVTFFEDEPDYGREDRAVASIFDDGGGMQA